ncbi:MAG: glycosyltransferase family 39 protein, partial [Actinobacteria bacterium]|nr:glycosyltransferase family 39 protein [Actinomycetota bacterium]
MQSAASAPRDAPARAWPRRRRLIIALVLLTIALSAAVRFAALDAFPNHVFDEYYYAHDAAALLRGDLGPRGAESWRPGEARSLAHPELGTLAIAAGIALFGDGPWGWRAPAALAGTLLIALMYPLARRLFLPPVWALAATVLAASDTMLIVESRLAVLDTFVALGSAACIYCALRATSSSHFARWTVLCGLAGGAAVASKWSGALAVVAALVILLLYARRLGLRKLLAALAAILALSLGVYVAGYAGYFLSGHSLADWLHLQRYMLGFNWGVRGTVSFASRPVTWLFDVHPIWYRFSEGSRGTTGLISIGNPLLWWGAALALVVLGVQALVRRDLRLGLAPLLVVLLYLPWLLTSRQAYIFYMTPVVPFLAILVAGGLSRIAGRRGAPCAPQALGFGGGALVAAAAFGVAGLGEGLLGQAQGALWRGGATAAGAALAAAAVIAAIRSPERRRAIVAAL